MLPTSMIESLRAALRDRYRAVFPHTGVWQYNRLPLYSDKLPFIILWSQKAASTVVLKWFFQRIGLLETALEYNSFAHVYETEVFKKRPGYVRSLKAAIADKNIGVIKFVRDPAARAFSSYLFLNRAPLYTLSDDPAYFWRQRILRYAYGADARADSVFSFTTYLEWLNEAAPRDIDGHLAPQFTSIESSLEERLQIYRAEKFDELIKAIEECFSITATPGEEIEPLRELTHHRPKFLRADTLDEIVNEGLPNPAQRRVSIPKFNSRTMQNYPQLKELIGAYFTDDYRAYGYKLDE